MRRQVWLFTVNYAGSRESDFKVRTGMIRSNGPVRPSMRRYAMWQSKTPRRLHFAASGLARPELESTVYLAAALTHCAAEPFLVSSAERHRTRS